MHKNWKSYKLGDLISYQKGFAFKSDWYKKSGELVVRVSDTTSSSIDISSCHRIDKDKASALQRYKLEKDDIVIATVGSWPPNYASVVGKVVKVPSEANGALLNQNAVRLKSTDETLHSKKYIYYLMKSEYFLKYIVNTAQGSASQASIKLTDIFDFKFNIPPLQEQQSIASILSDIDDKIENNLAINKTLEEMAMALYKHWFVDFGPFQDGKFVESELGMIPKGWEVKPFLDLFKLLSGGTPKTTVEDYWNGDIYWVSAKDIGSNSGGSYINDTEKKITQLGIDKSAAKILPEDTVIVVARGSVGKFGIIAKPMAINQSCYGIYSKSDYSQAVTYLLIKSLMSHFMNVSYGSVFDTITTSTFQNINILVPPNEIFAEIKNQVDVNFEQIKENIKENQSLTQLRNTLLPQLISGTVRLKEFRETVEEVV